MKTKIAFIVSCAIVGLICTVPASVFGANPRLAWDASTGADGYLIYFQENALTAKPGDVADPVNNNFFRITVSTTEKPLNELFLSPGKKYEIAVTAYNAAGESGMSNKVVYTVPAFIPPADVLPPIVITVPKPVPTITIKVD